MIQAFMLYEVENQGRELFWRFQGRQMTALRNDFKVPVAKMGHGQFLLH
jgi:hypothetical protein